MILRNVINLFRLFKVEYSQYRWHIALLGVLSFFGGILEGFGITAVIPVFSFLSGGKDKSVDFISQYIGKFFNFFHLPYTLKFLLIFIAILFILKAAFLFLANQISAYVATTYEKKMRRELFSLTLEGNWPYLSAQKIGYLNQMLITDVSNSSALLTYISMFLITLVNLLVYTTLVFNISAVIASLTVIFGVIVFLIFKSLFYKSRVLSQKASQLYKDMAHYVDEVVLGVKAIKSMFLEKQVVEGGYCYFDKVRDLNIQTVLLKNSINALLQPLGLILVIGIFAYFYKLASFNFASFAVIVYAINKVFSNLQISQVQMHQISSFVPYLSAVASYKNEAKQHKEKDGGTGYFSFNHRLEFSDVSFAYATDRGVLSGVSFSVNKGQIVGIIGPSGSGKTTIVDLILRLIKPNTGEIVIDGQSIGNIALREWRTNIGYVSQDAFLINDTIENNIKFFNEAVTTDDVARAAKLACAHEFIEQLPQKYDTLVGERGTMLSGGQRQRIILARVLVTNPQILILDEATSSLDNESELLIQQAIDNLKGKVTVISIAHRLSTVMSSDKLIVIEGGKIIEQGAPQELLKNQNSYLSRVYHLRDS